MDLKVFIIMATLTYGATEVIKGVINVYAPKIKIGLLMALIFGIAFDLGYGIGITSAITGIKYSETFIPELFMGMDILTTGALLSLGSKGLNAFLESKGVDVSNGIATALKLATETKGEETK